MIHQKASLCCMLRQSADSVCTDQPDDVSACLSVDEANVEGLEFRFNLARGLEAVVWTNLRD